VESYEIVEMFEKAWEKIPKNIPLVVESGGSVMFSLLLRVENLRIYVMLTVGVRGGIKELVLVFDTLQKIVADRLIVQCSDGGAVGRGALLPLAKLRQKVLQAPSGRRKLALELCEDAMWDYLEKLKDSPLDPDELRGIESTSQSLRGVVVGGVPSLGRRGGGAPGSH
jgi:hypothetical protein